MPSESIKPESKNSPSHSIKPLLINQGSKASKFLIEAARGVLKGADFVLAAFQDPYQYSGWYEARLVDERLWKESEKERAIKRLRKQKFIENRQKGDEFIVRLSSEAFLTGLRHLIVEEKEELKDNTACLVIYDFPVAANDARAFWRRFLTRAGFEQLQLSVWFSRKNVLEPLNVMINVMQVQEWICVCRAEFHPDTLDVLREKAKKLFGK